MKAYHCLKCKKQFKKETHLKQHEEIHKKKLNKEHVVKKVKQNVNA